MLFGIVCEASRTCPWHCLRGAHVQPVGPGLLAFRALSTIHEAPTFSQWVPAFSLSRLARARLSKSPPQTCPQRDQRLCAAHAHKRCSVALMPPTKSTGWAFPHTTLVLRQVFPRTPFKMSFLGFKRQQST